MTAGPLILLWLLMWATLDRGYWVCLLLAVPAAGFLVRLFMIQHDCGHGAFSIIVSQTIGWDVRSVSSRSRLTISGDALTPFTTRLRVISIAAEPGTSTR